MNHRTSVQFLVSHWAKLVFLCVLGISISWYAVAPKYLDQVAHTISVPTQSEMQKMAITKSQEDRSWDLEKTEIRVSDAPIMPTSVMSEKDFQQALESLAATGTWQELDQHLRLGFPTKMNMERALGLALKSQDLQKVGLLLGPEFRYNVKQVKSVWSELSNQVQLALDVEDQWYFSGLMQTTNLMAKYLPKVESEEVALLMKRMVAMNQNGERGPADVFSGRL